MSKDPTRKPGQDVSRRGLLEKAALAVGAATSVVAARTALARPSDVVMDSAGRVLIGGSTFAAQRPEGSFEEAAIRNRDNTSCTNAGGCGGGTNTGCTNTKGCLKASPTRAIQPTGAVPKTNAPMGVTGGGRSRK
jgi:hypothetical protein